MTKNRLISSILPSAAIESEQFQAGVIEGFHWAAGALAKGVKLPEVGVVPDDCLSELLHDTDWCTGWMAGYSVRRNRG